jgi:hypothetical protein
MDGRTEGRNLRNLEFAPKSDDKSDQKLFLPVSGSSFERRANTTTKVKGLIATVFY